MKRKLFILCLAALLLLGSCGKAEEDAAVNAIDFKGYSAAEIMDWAKENNVASSVRFVYVSDDTGAAFGDVLLQSVEPGKPISDEGIEITLSRGNLLLSGSGLEARVPNVIGKSFSDAKSELEALGFSVDSKYEDSTEVKDAVLLSDPLPGMSASTGSRVLLTLSSGSRREPKLSVKLDIPSGAQEQNTIEVYVDGEPDRSKTVCLDASVQRRTFYFSGSGTQTVRFTMNGEFLAEYTLDFDKETVKKIE